MGGTDNEVLGMQSGNFGNTRYHTHPIEPIATNVTWRVYYPGGGLRAQTSSSNTLTYLLTDHLNSTPVKRGQATTTLDTTGDITAWLRYDAWGVTRSSSGATPTDKRYTGQYEAEARMYFYNARWYDPETGRFAQADTIIPEAGDPLAWDRYAYVNNNPIKHCDTSGHCIDGLTTIPCLIALITLASFSGGAAIYQFNVSGNSWWESTEDVIATTKAGFEGMFLAVGAALTAGQVSLLAPDAAMWLGAKSNNTGLFSWGVNQARVLPQTISTNSSSRNINSSSVNETSDFLGGRNVATSSNRQLQSFVSRMEPEEAEKYKQYWINKYIGHAPTQSQPYDIYYRVQPENLNIHQVTTYNSFGQRIYQYDFYDKVSFNEHYHFFSYPGSIRSEERFRK